MVNNPLLRPYLSWAMGVPYMGVGWPAMTICCLTSGTASTTTPPEVRSFQKVGWLFRVTCLRRGSLPWHFAWFLCFEAVFVFLFFFWVSVGEILRKNACLTCSCCCCMEWTFGRFSTCLMWIDKDVVSSRASGGQNKVCVAASIPVCRSGIKKLIWVFPKIGIPPNHQF